MSRTGVLPAEKANCSSDKGLGDGQEPCEEPDNVLRGMLGRIICDGVNERFNELPRVDIAVKQRLWCCLGVSNVFELGVGLWQLMCFMPMRGCKDILLGSTKVSRN